MAENEVNLPLIITGVIMSSLNTFFPYLLKRTIKFIIQNNSAYNQLKKEVSDIKLELSKISAIDEFAKHARLQRKFNVLQGQLMDQAKTQRNNSLKIHLLVKYSLKFVLGITCMMVVWHYRGVPVIVFPPQWLYPLDSVVSVPTSTPGAISFGIWFLITNATFKTALRYYE